MWEHSDERLKMARVLGQRGGCLTCSPVSLEKHPRVPVRLSATSLIFFVCSCARRDELALEKQTTMPRTCNHSYSVSWDVGTCHYWPF